MFIMCPELMLPVNLYDCPSCTIDCFLRPTFTFALCTEYDKEVILQIMRKLAE